MTPDEERAGFTAALRELADAIDNNPAIPVPKYPRIQVGITADTWDAQKALVEAAATALDVTTRIIGTEEDERQIWADRMFGPVNYHVAACSPQDMELHRATQSYSGSVEP